MMEKFKNIPISKNTTVTAKAMETLNRSNLEESEVNEFNLNIIDFDNITRVRQSITDDIDSEK